MNIARFSQRYIESDAHAMLQFWHILHTEMGKSVAISMNTDWDIALDIISRTDWLTGIPGCGKSTLARHGSFASVDKICRLEGAKWMIDPSLIVPYRNYEGICDNFHEILVFNPKVTYIIRDIHEIRLTYLRRSQCEDNLFCNAFKTLSTAPSSTYLNRMTDGKHGVQTFLQRTTPWFIINDVT